MDGLVASAPLPSDASVRLPCGVRMVSPQDEPAYSGHVCVCEQERAPESSGELDLRSFSFVELLGSTVATGWLFVRLCVELVCWHPLGCIAIMCVCKLALF